MPCFSFLSLFMSLFFFVLDRCSFSESIRRSLSVIRRRRIRTAVLIVLWRFLSRLVFNIIPRAAVFILHGFLFLIIGEREGFAPASAFVLKQALRFLSTMILRSLWSCCLRLRSLPTEAIRVSDRRALFRHMMLHLNAARQTMGRWMYILQRTEFR